MHKSNDTTILHNLRERGYRLTPQRLAIMQILEDDGGHLSPVEIYERAVTHMPGITEATVYRTLDFLASNSLVLVAHVGDGRLVYEVAGHNHHHLICHVCGKTVEIEHHLLESLYAEFSEQTGFTIDHWHVTFFGVCPDCSKQKNGEKG
jgi:Fe2+ or Zn2+ uptake regulation protein